MGIVCQDAFESPQSPPGGPPIVEQEGLWVIVDEYEAQKGKKGPKSSLRKSNIFTIKE